MLLKNKCALITGSGRGIGKAIALRFAREGAAVALTGRREQPLREAAEEIAALGGKAFAFPCDLGDEAQVRELCRRAEEAAGPVDILVNNAGISREMPFVDMPLSLWEEMMRANLYSAVLVTQGVLPAMIRRKSGAVIHIASGSGLRGLPGSTAYSASKAALIAFGQALGDETRPHGLRVNVLCPGPVDTEMLRQSALREYLTQSGVKLFDPEEIASAAVFLASDFSGKMNSQVLVMRDGNRW